MSSETTSGVCEVCGVKSKVIRRGRCLTCYARWSESRPVGMGALCVVCNDRRRENLRLVEYQRIWMPMCHNCAIRAFRISPLPRTLEALKESLYRDRRWNERRDSAEDSRVLRLERRYAARRAPMLIGGEWEDAEHLIVEVSDEPEERRHGEETNIASAESLQE